ncbi:Enamine/imine deaminase [Hartmannibacter diazotrophicus]|uniref:Enamine/imine deaminase n=2 Tax=Hartmannibacter diazotrophicus TaxID=1482074 RepID=A0A2C9DDK5_9HYPH|nr:Enamine/imine deaminase [Hartmannibacter diazotrophicus]
MQSINAKSPATVDLGVRIGYMQQTIPSRLTSFLQLEFPMAITRFDKGPRMSQAVVHGNMVYLAGQTAENGATVADQTAEILAKIDALLARAGTDKSHLLQATIWLSDMATFDEMNKVWEAWVDPDNPPARATGEVKLAAPRYLVEIIIVATLP